MNFVERAHSLYEQQKTFEACITLSNGLKHHPHEEDALDWFLRMYCEEIPRPGLEADVLRILQKRADGADRFENLCAELEHLGAEEKYEALFDAVERHGIRFRRPTGPSSAIASGEAPLSSAPAGAGGETSDASGAAPALPGPASSGTSERWDRFSSPLDEADAAVPDAAPAATPEPEQAEDVAAEPTPETPAEGSERFELGTMDTLPEELRAQYAPTGRLPATKPKPNWTAIVVASVIVVGAFAFYVWGANTQEPPSDAPAFAPVVEASGEGVAEGSARAAREGSGSGEAAE